MEKIYVKLKDGGTIFFDHSQDFDIVHDRIGVCHKSPKVTAGLKAGLLIKVTEEEYKAYLAKVADGGSATTSAATATNAYGFNTKQDVADAIKEKHGIDVGDVKKLKMAALIEQYEALEKEKEAADTGAGGDEGDKGPEA